MGSEYRYFTGNIVITDEIRPWFKRWKRLMYRIKEKRYNVCDRWKTFEYFYEDLPKIRNYDLYIKDPDKYRLTSYVSDDHTIFDLEHTSFETSRTLRYMSSKNMGNRGVTYRGNGKFQAKARMPDGRIKCLGTYDNEEAAARAVDKYLIAAGDTSYLNDSDQSIDLDEHRIARRVTRTAIDTGKIYYAKGGKAFRFTGNYKPRNNQSGYLYEIEFIESGFRRYSHPGTTENRNVKDVMSPSVLGIGVLGTNGAHTKKHLMRRYRLWRTVILNISSRYPECTHDELIANDIVDARWLCFTDFLEEIKKVKGYRTYNLGVKCRLKNINNYTKKVNYRSFEFITTKSKNKNP